MIRVTIETAPNGDAVLMVRANLGLRFNALPRDVQTDRVERVLARVVELMPTVLASDDQIAVPA